jgi:AcrR family transcriptional regulator
MAESRDAATRSPKAEKSDASDARRTAILDAATRVFLRYGFKKTSMDDVARAAGVSRQGLYLHFETKELLFKETVLRLAEATREAGRAALANEEIDIEDRLVDGFAAIHGKGLDDGMNENGDELLEAATALVGPVVEEVDAVLLTGVVKILKSSGVSAEWKDSGMTAKDLAEHLLATSYGLKHRVSGSSEYREKMRIAVRLVCARRQLGKR